MSLPLNPFTSSIIPSMKKSASSSSLEKRDNLYVDRISNLPDDVLLKILKSMPTEQAVQTSLLSKRWEGVWKEMPLLFFDMRNTLKEEGPLAEQSHLISQLITKVINNHNGNLKLCKIRHLTPQTQDGTLETWIRSLVHVKHIKYLALERVNVYRGEKVRVLHLPPDIFSHPTLTSLLLCRYKFESAHAFNNCNNLIILKLRKIRVEIDVVNTVIASCPSLKMLVLEIFQNRRRNSCLKIHNDNLKFLHLACREVDNVEVSAALLDILSIHDIELMRGINIVLNTPRLLQLSQRFWKVHQSLPHIIYNISCDTQGNENIGHEFVMNMENYVMTVYATLAVSVDIVNPNEVYMLKKVLDAWSRDVQMLEIFFKDNDIDKKEGESSIYGIQNKWGNCFLDVNFRIRNVCLYNFNGLDEDQFALAASFVIQGKMMQSLMIRTSSLPANKKVAIEIAVAKLMKLSKGNKNLSIEYI